MRSILTVALLAMCALGAGAREVWRRNVEDVMGSAATVRTIAEASSVRVWRLAERKGHVALGALGKVDDPAAVRAADEALMLRVRYLSIGEGRDLASDQMAKLKALVLSQYSYAMHVDDETGEQLVLGDRFSPLVRIRFTAGDAAVETWVSFSWARMVVLNDEKVLGGSEINPMRQELLSVLKAALDGDPVMAKLR